MTATLFAVPGFLGHGDDFLPLAHALAPHRIAVRPVDIVRTAAAPGRTYAGLAHRLARRLAALAAQHGRPVDVLAYSLGARLALGAATACGQAARTPPWLGRLILIGGGRTPDTADARDARATLDATRAAHLRRVGMARFAVAWLTSPMIVEQLHVAPSEAAALTHRRVTYPAGVAQDVLRHAGPAAMPRLDGALTRCAPTALLLHGAHDTTSAAAAAYAAAIGPTAKVTAIADAGHAPHWVAPAATAAIIAAWLAAQHTAST